VVGQNTHLAGLRSEVDLDAVRCLVSVIVRSQGAFGRASERRTHPGTCRRTV
jgi:hypothetical protein